jgi:diguanylate cyclase (GGDEF)-like protein
VAAKPVPPAWTANIDSIPTLPTVAGRLIEMALSDNTTAGELGELLIKDPGLTARLLKAVNSTSYGLRSEVTSVSHAVSIVGRQALRSLVLGISIFDTFKDRNTASQEQREALWRHAVAVAAAAQLIAEGVGKVNAEEAYIAGLTHDIGKVVLDCLRPSEYKQCLAAVAQSGAESDRSNEARFCGISHVDLGDLLAERWALPTGIRAAIRYHHDPQAALNEATPIRRIVAITRAADVIATRCGYPSVESIHPPETDKVTKELLERVNQDAAVARVKEEVRKCAEVFKYGNAENADVWQRRLYHANAELSKAFAQIGEAQRIQQKARELIAKTLSFLGKQDPVELTLREMVEKLGYERAFFLQLADDYKSAVMHRLVSADGRSTEQHGRRADGLDPEFIPREGPVFIYKGQSAAADAILKFLGVPGAVLTPIHEDGKLKYLLGTDRGQKGAIGSDSATVDLNVHQLFAPSFDLLLLNDSLYKKAQYLSVTDVLTGVSNRRALMEGLEQIARQSAAAGTPYCAAMVDVDFFKKFNDQCGHQAGDQVLRAVAQTIRQSCRAGDLVGRYGGEEFCIVFPNTTHAEGLGVAERIRAAVESYGKANAQKYAGQAVAVSCGVATNKSGEKYEALLARADAALYRAKQSGRNRVESARAEEKSN